MRDNTEASKRDLYAKLGQMQIGETLYFRYPDLRFRTIGHCVGSYSGRTGMRFKVEPDYHKGVGVTRTN